MTNATIAISIFITFVFLFLGDKGTKKSEKWKVKSEKNASADEIILFFFVTLAANTKQNRRYG